VRAIIQTRYGGPEVLEARDVPMPSPGANGVLIRVRTASVNRSDWEMLTGRPAIVRMSGAGFRRPTRQVLGSDVAGTVEAVGSAVTQFRPGDEVLGDTLWHGMGGFAEYVVAPEESPLVAKPPEVSFEDAAALPQAAVLAFQGLRTNGPVRPGDQVLVNGAGGGAGSFAIQLARSYGAEVTGVDSTEKLDTMRSLGASHVVDYTRDDFAAGDRRYDRILDFWASRSILTYRRALRPDGVYAMVGGTVPKLLQAVSLGWVFSGIARPVRRSPLRAVRGARGADPAGSGACPRQARHHDVSHPGRRWRHLKPD
jgi:NADPH:quinone reductase-like Zn-dependent oxidoreductase